MNAQCVSVNAKAIQPCVESELYWVYEVNGKRVRSQRVKVCAVNAINMLVLNYVFPFRLERHTLFSHGILSARMSVRLSVRYKICPLYSWKPFKTLFMKLNTFIKHRYTTTIILLYSFWSYAFSKLLIFSIFCHNNFSSLI